MKIFIQITGADIEEYPNEIIRPDYPIEFTSNFWGEFSAEEIAQTVGTDLWRNMHGDTPLYLYYTWQRQD